MKHSDEKGSIYITVVIVLAVVLMLLGMLIVVTSRDMRTSNLYSAGIRAQYIAQSGVAEGIAYAKSHPETDKTELDKPIFSSDYSANPRVNWDLHYDDDTTEIYTIVSQGSYRYNDKITVRRTLEVEVKIGDDNVEVISWKQK